MVDPRKVCGIGGDEAVNKFSNLSRRERQVAELMADGLKNVDVAKKLSISTKTLDIHRSKICDKMECNVISIPRIVIAARIHQIAVEVGH